MGPKGKVIGWVWDNSSDREIGQGLCISATPDDFRRVAGYLLSYALRWPDKDLSSHLKSTPIFDAELRGAAQHIALQMLNLESDCEPAMPYPILRQNPENVCQMQQSLDGGDTWTTVFDSSVCQPEIPEVPPMIQFRQNSESPELLEQSFDDGVTWSTAFDYSKYRPRSSTVENTIAYNQILETINTYNQIWNDDSSVTTYAPNMVYDGGDTDDDQQRDKAICYAIGAWYDVTKQAVVDYAANKNDALAATSAAGVTAAVSVFGTPFAGFLAGAVVGVLVKGVSLLGAASQESAYTAARDEIICCMYEGLKGDTLTQERFQASVSACGFESGSDTEAIRVLINAMVQDQSVYLSFLKAASSGFDYAEFAELPDCPCEDEDEGTANVALVNAYSYPSTLTFLGNPTGHPERDIWQVTSEVDPSNPTYTGYNVRDNTNRCIRLVSYMVTPGTETAASALNCSGGYVGSGSHHSDGEEWTVFAGNTSAVASFTFVFEVV